MNKRIIALLFVVFCLFITACTNNTGKDSDVNQDENHIIIDTDTDKTNESVGSDSSVYSALFSPSYIKKDCSIVLTDSSLSVSGFVFNNPSIQNVDSFIYVNDNLFVVAEEGISRYANYDEEELAEYVGDYSVITEALNQLNTKDKIRYFSKEWLFGDTLLRPKLYAFTDSGKCMRVSFEGKTEEIGNDITYIIDENGHIVTLYKNGTVNDNCSGNDTSLWSDIVFIDTNRTDGAGITVGVDNEGRVFVAGDYMHDISEIENWHDVLYAIVIDVYTDQYPIALSKNGTVLVPSDCGCSFADKVSEWSNVIEIGLTCPDGILWGRLENGDVLFAE